MRVIESETRFIWKLMLHLLLTPITLILVLFRKREPSAIFQPFTDIATFIFEPKFTISMIFLTVCSSLAGFYLLSEQTFLLLVSLPSDIMFPERYYAFITSGFIHANYPHLLWNMLALFIFGRVVERKLGTFKTAAIYFSALFISGVASSALDILLNQKNTIALGASGAIMGLVGAAVLLDPFYLTYEFAFPMPVMFAGWLTILGDLTGILSAADDGIGHVAHLAGYLSVTFTLYLYGEKDSLRKGLFVNLLSLAAVGILYYLLKIGRLPHMS